MTVPDPNQAQRSLLAEALQLSRSLNQTSHLDSSAIRQRQERLRQIREQLKSFAHPINRTALPVEMIPLEVRYTFVQAALLVSRYQQVGGQQWQGTLVSPTLTQYQADPLPDGWQIEGAQELGCADAITELCQQFHLSAEASSHLAQTLQRVDAVIDQQTRIIQTVIAEAQADQKQSAQAETGTSTALWLSRSGLHSLFQHLFGAVPLPPEAIDGICTPMQIYFCIDYQESQLPAALWNSLNEFEQAQVGAFLDSLGQFSFERFQRFPIFGPCTASTMDRVWCDRIAQKVGLPTSTVIQSLIRAVSIIPTQKAEAFLVHDIWGHHWQLVLTQFESDYDILKHCDEPLRAGETAYTADGPLSCRELFELRENQVILSDQKARIFFRAEVEQRLGLMFTHLLGEMLADVAEFKFIWDYPDCSEQLPSSSLFKTNPTKLDLSLADLDFLFLRVLRSLLEYRLSVLETSDLEQDLLADWRQTNIAVESLELRTSLKLAIAQLYHIFLEEYNAAYLPTLTGDVGLFTQMIGNLLHLQNVVDSLYTDAEALSKGLPFQDLLLLFIGCYCSGDSYREFWAIDDVLAAYFLPCWRHWAKV